VTGLPFIMAMAVASPVSSAVIVGTNVGLGSEQDLLFAESDAQGVSEALAEVGTVARADIAFLRQPTLAATRRALQHAADAPPSDLFVFYMSSHGDPAGAHLRGELLSWSELSALLARVPAKRVLAVVDACQSGALLTSKGIVRGPPITLSLEPLGQSGRYLITSSGSNEASYESTWLQGSPFTQLFLSGLRGAADSDGDGEVSFDELYRYLYERSIAATLTAPGGPQHPGVRCEMHGSGDFVIARINARSPVSRRVDARGTCYVLDEEGIRVLAELPPTSAAVALPPGRYQVKCLSEGRLAGAEAVLPPGVVIDELHFSSLDRTYAVAKGPSATVRGALSLELGLTGDDDFEFGPALFGGYRWERTQTAFEILAGANLRTGALSVLGGASVLLPFSLGIDRLEIGLLLGPGFNPFVHGLDPSILFGPQVRFEAPLDDRFAFFARAAVLTRVPFTSSDIGVSGSLDLGLTWDPENPK
jgi:hypothetical protein